MSNFSPLSNELTKKLSKSEKKSNGIFFTPYDISRKNINIIKSHIDINNIKNVLEPSCGSCNFIDIIDKEFNNIKITAIELNTTIFNSINILSYNNPCVFLNQDYLKYETTNKYDLIIGNPPYFTLLKKDITNEEWKKYHNGRPNIFTLFILKSLELLSENGILSFILPNSFNNSYYYNDIRRHIYKNYTIINITDHTDIASFKETKQAVSSFIIQNKKPNINPETINTDYTSIFKKEHFNTIIFNDKNKLKEILSYKENTTTLFDLNCSVSTGKIVWNQVKEKLTNNPDDTILIYTRNIVEKEFKHFELKDACHTKKNYIEKAYINDRNIELNEPVIVVNRGYGNAKYHFNYALINLDESYVIENHLIQIKLCNTTITKDEKIKFYEKIITSFNNPKTTKFIEKYCDNNGLSNNELKNIIPIYLTDI